MGYLSDNCIFASLTEELIAQSVSFTCGNDDLDEFFRHDFIKFWFTDTQNKTGCRYLVVDAYNCEMPLSFYLKNGFDFVFGSEAQEKEYRNISSDRNLRTRLMFFDLIRIS